MTGLEIKGRLDRIGKTPLEHFQDIKELEVADEQGLTVKDIVPYKCEQVEKSLKALEIIKEYQVDVWLLKQCDYKNYIRIRKEAMVSVGQFVNENGVILEDEIPEEYFDLVKRWVR